MKKIFCLLIILSLFSATQIFAEESKSPLSIETSATSIRTGYQSQPTADIIIRENNPSALKSNKTIRIFISDEISDDSIYFLKDFKILCNENSNIKISEPIVNNGAIEFDIIRSSSKIPAEIRITNLHVKTDRTVPNSNNRPYKVVIGGNAIAENYYNESENETTLSNYDAKFTVMGIGIDYIFLSDEYKSAVSPSADIIKFTDGSNIVKIGNTDLHIDVAPYVSEKSDSFMLPVRFLAQTLGVSQDEIVWNDETKSVTIFAGDRVVRFALDSDFYILNGMSFPLNSKKVEIKNNRVFVPLKTLGDALGFSVYWEDDTRSAICNFAF